MVQLKRLTTIKAQLDYVCEATATVERQDRLLAMVKVHPKLIEYFLLLQGDKVKLLRDAKIEYKPCNQGTLYYWDFFSGYLKYITDDCKKSLENKAATLYQLLGVMQAPDALFISQALKGIPAYDTLRLNEFVLSVLDLKKQDQHSK